MQQRLRQLQEHMLPKRFSPTGDYSARQLDRARGYRLLAHAEIEAFIEDITFEAVKRSISRWSNTKIVNDSLFCLVAHYHRGFEVEGDDTTVPFPAASRPKAKEAIKEVVDVAMRQYQKIHADNNGVREKNLYRLILPVGVYKEELDSLWITNLNEFSKRRGDVAHKAVKAQQQVDPKFELDTVNDLLVGLETLDSLVANLAP